MLWLLGLRDSCTLTVGVLFNWAQLTFDPLHYCIDKVMGFIDVILCTVQHAAFTSG